MTVAAHCTMNCTHDCTADLIEGRGVSVSVLLFGLTGDIDRTSGTVLCIWEGLDVSDVSYVSRTRNPIQLAVSLPAIHQLFGYINFVLYRPSIHQIHPASRVDRAASRYIVFDTSFWRYSSDTRYSDTTRYIVSDVSPPLCSGWLGVAPESTVDS